METIFTVTEIVDIGIEKEKARRDFYGKVAEHFEDPDLKNLFLRLRDWETGHVKKFESIKKQLNGIRATESYPCEMQAYMDALVDDKLYKTLTAESFAENIEDPVDAIDYGIGFEKDAILLFMELLSYLNSDQKEIVSTLMEEERQHIVHLIKLKKKYK